MDISPQPGIGFLGDAEKCRLGVSVAGYCPCVCGRRIRRHVMCDGEKGSGSGPGQGCRGCGRLTEFHPVQAWVVVEHAVRKCHKLVVVCAYGGCVQAVCCQA